MRKTSIVIVTYNHLDYIKDCIESIYKYTEEDTYEIIIVDNNSDRETKDWIKNQKKIISIFNPVNLGFVKASNQGIKLANRDHDILLLNSDTIVTFNWLNNLKTCLTSDSLIGAVGAVSNHNENDQGVDFSYDDFITMQRCARENNISDSTKWEEKIFLIGFCLLIRREVIDKIGYLDEAYSPGYIEDNDLSLRIVKEGYKLMLCHDVFIHHYLGTSFRKDLDKFYRILNKNRSYFIKKWGFSSFAFDEVKHSSLQVILHPKKVLEFDCGIAPTLLRLKYLYPGVIVHGIESDSSKANLSREVAVVYSSLEEVRDYDYDCILIGNLLERVSNPEEFLATLRKYLKRDGFVIGEIQNASSFDNVSSLLSGNWYYTHKDKMHCYTYYDLERLLQNAGYTIDYTFSWYRNFSEEEEKNLLYLREKYPNFYETVSYTFRFKL